MSSIKHREEGVGGKGTTQRDNAKTTHLLVLRESLKSESDSGQITSVKHPCYRDIASELRSLAAGWAGWAWMWLDEARAR